MESVVSPFAAEKKTWHRECPGKCGRTLSYTLKASRDEAEKKRSVCWSCAADRRKVNQRTRPYAVRQIYRLHNLGLTTKEIAESTGVHRVTVERYLKSKGLKSHGRRKGPYTVDRCLMKRCRGLKYSAAVLGLPFSLTVEYLKQLYELQKGLCFYTDVELITHVGVGHPPNSLSVDKIEPNLGYVPGNVVLCSKRANSIKHDQSLEELSKWMPLWHERIEMWRKNGLRVIPVRCSDRDFE